MEKNVRSGSRIAVALSVAAGLAVVGLSLVEGWVIHVRHQGGHGLTEIVAVWSAWEGRAWPFLPLAVAAALGLGLLAGLELVAPARVRRTWLAAVATVCLALLLAALWPIAHGGYTSQVEVSAGWPVAVSAGLMAAALVALLATGRWGRRALLAVAGATAALAVLTVAGRMLALDLAEGDPRNYAAGTYRRPATDGLPAATLVIGDGSYAIEGSWSGTLSGTGLVVVLTGDPACADDRGSYRVFPVGEEDIRFNTIVDLCADGARARELATGVWERQD